MVVATWWHQEGIARSCAAAVELAVEELDPRKGG